MLNVLKLFLALTLAVLSQTPANVLPGTGAEATSGYAGATITAGMPLYADASDGDTLKPCQATTAAAATCVGIALHGAFDGQPIRYQTVGNLNLGATLTAGEIYVVDDGTAGAIAVPSELDSGDFVKVLGVAISTSEVQLLLDSPVVEK